MEMRQQSKYQFGSLPGKVKEWEATGIGIASKAALPLMVIMRTRVGFRKLSLGSLFALAGILLLFNAIGNFHFALPFVGNIGATHQSESLKYFAYVFLALGLYKRHREWKALKGGDRWHTYSAGISYFEFLPIRKDFIYRVVDPLVAFIVGLCLRKVGFGGLGLFLIFSSICLCVLEEYARKRQLQEDLDTLDNLLEAEMQGRTVEHFEGQGSEPAKPRSLRQTGGIPSAADAGLEAEIARRKQEAAAKRNNQKAS